MFMRENIIRSWHNITSNLITKLMLQKDTELSQENNNEIDDYHHQATNIV